MAACISHEQPEALLRFVTVVRRAAQFEIVSRGRTTLRVRHDMVKLEKPRFSAAAGWPFESTTATIARPYRTANFRRHASRVLVGRPRYAGAFCC